MPAARTPIVIPGIGHYLRPKPCRTRQVSQAFIDQAKPDLSCVAALGALTSTVAPK